MMKSWAAGAPSRRLPLYIVLDCSSWLRRASLLAKALHDGMVWLYIELLRKSGTRDKVWISVITYGDSAARTDLVPIEQFTPPFIAGSGVARLDGALHLLAESIEADIRPNTVAVKGDYRPLVLLFSERQPTDEHGYPRALYQGAQAQIHALSGNRKPVITAIFLGHDIDVAALGDIANDVHAPETGVWPDVTAIRGCFHYIAQCVHRFARDASHIPTPPPGFTFQSGGSWQFMRQAV